MKTLRRWWHGESRGEKAHTVALRVTEEECDRIEELRRELRLRSASEVVRFALQVVECACQGRRIEAQSADEVVAMVEDCLNTCEQE